MTIFLGKRFSVSILIFDEEGNKISNLWSEYQFKTFVIAKQTKVKCEIEKWPFRIGEFRFDVFTHIQQESIEWVEEVCRINSENGDYFGNGILTNSNQGNFFINHLFK